MAKPEHEGNTGAAFARLCSLVTRTSSSRPGAIKFYGSLIKTDGNRHLGAAPGSPEFCGSLAMTKVKDWEGEIRKLATIAAT